MSPERRVTMPRVPRVSALVGGRRRRWVAWALVVLFAVVATPLEPFSWGGRIATAIVGIGVATIAIGRRQLRRRTVDATSRASGGIRTLSAIVWVVLLSGLAAFQLAIFSSQPREIYPTLSSLINPLIEPYPVRAAAFVAWIWLGWDLVAKR